MESSSGGSSTLLHKIIIPVITTVLGATAIYFLGFNKKAGGRTEMEQMLLSKEATVKAWKSFVTAYNISSKNIKSLAEQYGGKTTEASKQGLEKLVPVWKDYEKELLRESNKFNQDVEQILQEKDIDRDFVSMLNRTLDNEKNQEKKTTSFFDKMIALVNSNQSQSEKITSLQNELTKFLDDGKKDTERTVTEAEGIAKILAEKYNQAFNLNDLELYVEYKKEKENEKKSPNDNLNVNKPIDNSGGGIAPADPNKVNEVKGTTQNDNNPTYDNTRTNNQTEPTESLLTGNWVMTGGELELNDDGEMNWTFGNGFVSGDWKLTNGKLRMNGTILSTGQRLLLIGEFSDFTRNSFTLTLISATPRETYYFTRRR